MQEDRGNATVKAECFTSGEEPMSEIYKHYGVIQKSTTATQVETEGSGTYDIEMTPPYPLEVLDGVSTESQIIPQCIEAYKRNIVGFGINVEYKEDVEETVESKREKEMVKNVIDGMSLDQSFKKELEEIIDDAERYGYTFAEVIRDTKGKVVELIKLDYIEDVIVYSKQLQKTSYTTMINGQLRSGRRRFRKYKQELDGQTVFFKEFGDPRKMDLTTGAYSEDVPDDKTANELWHFKIGNTIYGNPRWDGILLDADGVRRSRNLNWSYFDKGRHTPFAIIFNGMMTQESRTAIQDYQDSLSGEKAYHKILTLEVDSSDPLGDGAKGQNKIEIKDLSPMLQNDALFTEYMEEHRKDVQSKFRLPDLYLGRTKDFNVATAKEAKKVTEEQVFQPYREDLEWFINNKLLAEYNLKYCKVVFKKPSIDNTDLMVEALKVAVDGGAASPNFVGREYARLTNTEWVEIEQEWANMPIKYLQNIQSDGGDITKSLYKDLAFAQTLEEFSQILKDLQSKVN